MLSICIPHYNYSNLRLFETLLTQCLPHEIQFEILIADDASHTQNKTYLNSLKHPAFQTFFLKRNIGRSAIRNFLANKAQYRYLLFLDADAELIHEDFISSYLNNLNNEIICGGRVYDSQKPAAEFCLHWTYGTRVEQKAKRNFQSNNFLVPKNLFYQIKFDEQLTGYGYEDVLFGLQIKQLGYTVKHINNPVKHIQLKTNKEFIADTENALRNLYKIINSGRENLILRQVSIASLYKKLQLFKLSFILSMYNKSILGRIKQRLLSKSDSKSLIWLTLYKLYFFYSLHDT